MPEFEWYILKVKSNYEGRVKETITSRLAANDISDQVQEIRIPKESVVSVVKGKKRTREKSMYPGYVFIQMKLNDNLQHLIKETNHVISFIGGDKLHPRPVPEDQLDVVNKKVQESIDNPQAQASFSEGETVVVIEGPFKTFNGVVEEVNPEKCRVKVSVKIFGRPTPVELDFEQVHKER